MKQTAVEWLFEKLPTIDKYDPYYEEIFQQAKEMEKEQIIDAFGVGRHVESTRLIHYNDMAEQYYNETYKQD
jgi:DNA-directed RNA polymerase subunit N (RpoN/RPB10)